MKTIQGDKPERSIAMQLRDVMTRDIQEIPPEATLKKAAETMRSLDVGALPVCENNRVIGMLTDRDIAMRAVAEGRDPNQTKVRDAMTGQLVYCYEDDTVENAAKLMEEKQIRRLPVMDRNQRLCGIVSLGDLATRNRDDRLSGEVLERVSEPNVPHA
jgi:CBS domain-containing protein